MKTVAAQDPRADRPVRVASRDLGYPLQAFITAVVDQHRLDEVIKQLQTITRVTKVTRSPGSPGWPTYSSPWWRPTPMTSTESLAWFWLCPGVERTHDVGGDARGRCLPHPAVVGAAPTAAVSTNRRDQV
jgi:hypothetical protein